jgi:hypothetical protein
VLLPLRACPIHGKLQLINSEVDKNPKDFGLIVRLSLDDGNFWIDIFE